MSVTPNMGLILPTVSSTPGPTYATEQNTAMEVIDAHDHTSGNGVQVPTAGIGIDADLTFSDYNATNVNSVRFYNNSTALAGGSDLGCVYEAGGNLYFNDASGVQIQLTAGGALNAASIGGIGGDYSTSTASEYYSSVTKTFYFTQDTNKPAHISGGNVVIAEAVTSPNTITLQSPTSLAASYTVTMPTAVPASTLPLAMSSSGVLSTGQITASQITTGTITGTQISSTANITMNNATINGTATIASATITSLTGGIVAVNNSLQFQSHNVVVSQTNASVPLAIIRGFVAVDGASTSGEGFSVNNIVLANSQLSVTFTTAFADTPAIIVAPQAGLGTLYHASVYDGSGSTNFTVRFFDSTGTQLVGTTPAFTFIATGKMA